MPEPIKAESITVQVQNERGEWVTAPQSPPDPKVELPSGEYRITIKRRERL